MKFREAKNETEYPSTQEVYSALKSELLVMVQQGIVIDTILSARGQVRDDLKVIDIGLDSNDGPDLAMSLYERLRATHEKLVPALSEEAAHLMSDGVANGWTLYEYAAKVANWCMHHIPFEG